jgi:hypothetical protein
VGAFAIIRRDKRRPRLDIEEQVKAAFRAQGFAEPKILETEYARILLYPKLDGGPLNAFIQDNGQFTAYTGLAVYKGSTGEPALQHLSRFDIEHHVAPDDFSGAFALIQNNSRGLKLMLDPSGVYKVYTDPEKTVFTSSFLALLAATQGPKIDAQGVYEYVFDGTNYGRTTPIAQILTLESGTYRIARVVGENHKHKLLDFTVEPHPKGFFIAQNLKLLRTRTHMLTQAFGSHIDLALTGGYDARLMLALLREAGVTPRLHIYGDSSEAELKMAQKMALGEGLKIIHANADADNRILLPDIFTEVMASRYQALDGCPPEGLFGNNARQIDRQAGQQGGYLALGPSGGTIYRNFFGLGNRPHGSIELLWSFWCRFDPAAGASHFSEDRYLKNVEKKMLAMLPTPSRLLSRPEIEYLYPVFYGRQWSGRNLSILLRSGHAALPFLDDPLIRAAARIPYKFKQKGRFTADLIAAIDPRLASYTETTPAPEGRFRDLTLNFPPPVLRRLAFRLRNRFLKKLMPWYLDTTFIKAALPQGLIYMPRFFHVEHIHDAAQMNRLLTLEYLFQKINARHTS